MTGSDSPKPRQPDTAATGGEAQARAIYQDFMDRLNLSYFNDDFDLFRDLVHLPAVVGTFDTRMVLKTEDDLRRIMVSVRRFLQEKNVTTYLRVCLAARFVSDDMIEGTHESHALNRMEYVEPRFPVKSVLRRIDGTWKLVEADHAVENDAFLPATLLRNLSHTIELRPDQARAARRARDAKGSRR